MRRTFVFVQIETEMGSHFYLKVVNYGLPRFKVGIVV
jgi:hypothetical protein